GEPLASTNKFSHSVHNHREVKKGRARRPAIARRPIPADRWNPADQWNLTYSNSTAFSFTPCCGGAM
ncbi:MAG: hypothetical protein ACK595_15600, partial [Planctomycetota bacterium]